MVLIAAGFAASVQAATTLSDGRDGANCKNLVAGSKMAWVRPGGDWIDAAGTQFGPAEFAVGTVPAGRSGQVFDIDITPLVRTWESGEAPVGGVFLTRPVGVASGSVSFHSRESDDPAVRPVLRLTWQDGRVSELAPSADASLNCSTSKALGGAKTIGVGRDDRNAVLLFPFKQERGRAVKAAQLVLTVQRQYGSATVAVFRPLVPWAQATERKDGLAKAFPRDEGIETHPAVVFAERFETDGWAEHLTPIRENSPVGLTDGNPGEGYAPLDGQALKVTIPVGRNLGLNTRYKFESELGHEPEEMYFRYALRFGADWDPTVSGGKLPGFVGTYGRAGWGGRKANGRNGWSTRGTFFEHRDASSSLSELRGIGSYVYHADMPTHYGNLWGWNLGTGGLLRKNRWYSIEQQVRLNTPGLNDGVLRAWIDGFLVFERTDLRFRDIPELKIESLWLNVYHGGTDPAVKEMSLYIDNLVISREYIGPVHGAL